MIKFLKQWWKDFTRLDTHCRVCKTQLHKPGGYLVPYVGRGFCIHCATYITSPTYRCLDSISRLK